MSVDELVGSLLYEGYALYPYTPGTTKNATPTPFGIVYPPAYAAGGPLSFDRARMQLVLEPAGLDRAMDAALLRRVHLPPPAAVAAGLAGRNRTRARCAADRGVAAIVERVVGHVALAHVVPDLLLRPLG